MVRCASFALLLSFLLSHCSEAQEAPEYIKEYAKESKLQRLQEMAASKIRARRKRQPGGARNYAAALADPMEPFYGTMESRSIRMGSIGRLDWFDASVFQVIDGKNMLVELAWQVPVIKSLNPSEAATAENVYRGVENRTLLVWVRGVDTSQLTDGKGLEFQGLQPQGVFAVRKAETYRTRAGSKTVPVLEEVDMSAWAPLFTMRAEMREWRDKSGKHSIEASFVDHKGGIVHLTADGRRINKLKLSELSDDDQDYVRQVMRERRTLSVKDSN